MFAVETNFQKKAREGGVPREKAIAQAEKEIEGARPGYDQWVDNEVRELAALMKSAQSGTVDAHWMENANFRSSQLRDSAGALATSWLSSALVTIISP